MSRHLKGTIGLVEFVEKACIGSGWFVLVRDGSKECRYHDGGGEPSFFTKTYHMKLDGEWVDTWIKFVYNHRDECADFFASRRDLDNFRDAISGKDAEAGAVTALLAEGERVNGH